MGEVLPIYYSNWMEILDLHCWYMSKHNVETRFFNMFIALGPGCSKSWTQRTQMGVEKSYVSSEKKILNNIHHHIVSKLKLFVCRLKCRIGK